MSPTTLVVLLSLVGTSLSAGIPHIIDGVPVNSIEKAPWQGAVYTETGDFLCGCSLITSQWAVTAASCVQSPQRAVRFGSTNRKDGTLKPVLEVIVHEDYRVSGSHKFNDVAVMRFSSLTLSDKIKPIKMGETDETNNPNCFFTGWGLLDTSDNVHPDILHYTEVTVAPQTSCDDDWSSIDSSHVCTYNSGWRVTCRGDEGGPFYCYKGDHYELVGISSWQSSSCSRYVFPVYSRVSFFRQWILGKTRTTHK